MCDGECGPGTGRRPLTSRRAETPARALLVVIAFIVAAFSLLAQGGTIGWLAGRLGPDEEAVARQEAETAAEHSRLLDLMQAAAQK